jgi:hypothetical protein
MDSGIQIPETAIESYRKIQQNVSRQGYESLNPFFPKKEIII